MTDAIMYVKYSVPVLDNQVPVYISSGRSTSTIPGSVVWSAEQLHKVQKPTGLSRHNRSHLHERPVDDETSTVSHSARSKSPILTRFKTRIVLHNPNILT